jgi:hypothetical protein
MSANNYELLDELAWFMLNKSATASALREIIGARIYQDAVPELNAPPNSPDPHVILYEIDSQSEESLTGPGDLEHTSVQFACRADQPKLAGRIRRIIRDGLANYRGYLQDVFVSYISLSTRIRHGEPTIAESSGIIRRTSLIQFKIGHSVPLPTTY